MSDPFAQGVQRNPYSSFSDEFYGYSDFRNMGFWDDGTRSQKHASGRLLERLLEFLPEKNGTILDVGCGKGATTAYLLKYWQAEAVTGIDVAANLLEIAGQRAPGCTFRCMDATKGDFKDASFDNVICVEGGPHFESREAFLREAFRVLRDGGWLLMSDLLTAKESGIGAREKIVEPHFSNPNEYRIKCESVGFRNLEVVNATEECMRRHYEHLFRFLLGQLESRKMSLNMYVGAMRIVLAMCQSAQTYVLIAAQKPAPPSQV